MAHSHTIPAETFMRFPSARTNQNSRAQTTAFSVTATVSSTSRSADGYAASNCCQTGPKTMPSILNEFRRFSYALNR